MAIFIQHTIVDEQKWLDQEELKAHTNRVREMIKAMFTEVCYFWDRNGGL